MNVVSMMNEVLMITNSVIRESALPDLSCSPNDGSESVGIAAFDQLDCMFKRDVVCRCKEQMHVLRHHDESVYLEASFTAIAVQGLKEESDVILDDKQPSSLPSREGYEVSSGRGDESFRLHEQTSAAKAAIFA